MVIHTHGTNVTLDLRWRLASGSGQLLEWSEAQRQVEAASGKVLQSHNESHAFRRYSPTPDAAAFGPPAGVACEGVVSDQGIKNLLSRAASTIYASTSVR